MVILELSSGGILAQMQLDFYIPAFAGMTT